MKKIKLDWWGIRESKYWDYILEFVGWEERFAKRAKQILATFEGLEVFMIGWKGEIVYYGREDKIFLSILERIMEEKGVRVERRRKETMV